MRNGRARLENRVDKRRHRRALAEHDEPTENRHHDKNRQQPEFFADFHEGPEFGNKIQDRLLELIAHGIRRRPSGVANDPITFCLWLKPAMQGVLAEQPHQKRHRRDRQIKQQPHDDGVHDFGKRHSEPEPQQVQGPKNGGYEKPGAQEDDGRHQCPDSNGPAIDQRPQPEGGEEDSENNAEALLAAGFDMVITPEIFVETLLFSHPIRFLIVPGVYPLSAPKVKAGSLLGLYFQACRKKTVHTAQVS